MGLTENQKKAVTERGGSILVSASAGSGKTTVLTQRVLDRLMTEPRTDINRLLILTFTKAAAAEMRRKIKEKIEETIGKDPSKHGYLRRQLMLLDGASISTVDAFCNNLIRENYEKTGISFDAKTAEAGDISIIKRAAAERLLEEFITEENRELFDDIDVGKNDGAIIDNIVKKYEDISVHPFPDEWMKKAYEMYDPDILFEDTAYYDVLTGKLRHICKGVIGIIEGKLREVPVSQDGMSCADLLNADKNHILDIINGIDRRDYENLLKITGEPFVRITSYGKEDPELKEELKELRDGYKKKITDTVKKLFDFTGEEYKSDTEKLRPTVKLYIDLLRKYGEIFSEMKRERNLIDYADMEDMTIRLLYEEKDGQYAVSDTAKALREQYDEIMVDEFQDTNEKQNAIYFALSRDGNNLFCVGDIKQSIYRFRLADPGIFIKKKEECREGGFPKLINLSDNFRSSESVCATANGIFEYIMSEEVGETAYGENERLYCNKEGTSPTEIYITEKVDGTSEAEMIADIIEDLVKGNGDKPVRYGDIAILFRTAKKWTNYTNVFKLRGIPVHAGDTEGYLKSRECDSMLQFLRAIDNPYADTALTAAMMSPVFCFTPDDMLKLKLARKEHLYEAMVQSEDERVQKFYRLIKRYKELSFSLPVSGLIKKIMHETEFSEIYSSFYGGEVRKSNLMKLLQLAKTKEASTVMSLSYFLSYCGKIKDNPIGTPEVTGSPDAVRMMTIHGSKGLEFPVCILAETDRVFNIKESSDTVNVSAKLGICMRMRDHKRFYQYKTVQSNSYSAEKEKNELSEEMRVLYVALTRAKDKMIVTASQKDRDRFMENAAKTVTDRAPGSFTVTDHRTQLWWILLGTLTSRVTDNFVSPGLFVREGMPVKVILYDKKKETANAVSVAAPDENILKILHESAAFRYKDEGLRAVPVRMSVSEIAKKDSTPTFSARPSFSEKKDSTAAERGTATHKFMQFVDYENGARSVKDEAKRLEDEFFMSHKDITLCDLKGIERFFESDLYKKIAAADKVLREYPFMYGISAERLGVTGNCKNETVLVQGIADLIIIRNGTFSVIDYKTDNVKSEETLTERYAEQLQLYGEALTEKLSLPLDKLIIYSFALDKEIVL